jgi:hypothetical protein
MPQVARRGRERASRPLVETADGVGEPQNRRVVLWVDEPQPSPR